LRKIFVPSGR